MALYTHYNTFLLLLIVSWHFSLHCKSQQANHRFIHRLLTIPRCYSLISYWAMKKKRPIKTGPVPVVMEHAYTGPTTVELQAQQSAWLSGQLSLKEFRAIIINYKEEELSAFPYFFITNQRNHNKVYANREPVLHPAWVNSSGYFKIACSRWDNIKRGGVRLSIYFNVLKPVRPAHYYIPCLPVQYHVLIVV